MFDRQPPGSSLDQKNSATDTINETKETDKGAIGFDSLGKPILRGSTLVYQEGEVFSVINGTNPKNIRDFVAKDAVGYVLTPESVDQVVDKVKITPRSKIRLNQKFIDKSKTPEYINEVKAEISAQKDDKPHDRNFDRHPHLSLGRFNNFAICNVRISKTGITFDLEGFDDDVEVEISPKDGYVYLQNDRKPCIISCKPDPEGGFTLNSYRVDSLGGDKKIHPVELVRIDSPEAVVDKLKTEFPWVDVKDIFNDSDKPSFANPNGWISIPQKEVLSRRFDRLYPNSDLQGVVPNIAEIFYMAARSYLRFLEMSVTPSILEQSNPTTRREKFIEYLEVYDSSLDNLINRRRGLEFKYLGEPLIDRFLETTDLPSSVASSDTLGTKSSVIARIFNKEEIVWVAPEKQVRRPKISAEAHAHELGHRVHSHVASRSTPAESSTIGNNFINKLIRQLDRTVGETKDWNYEEIYNQLLSVILPLGETRDPLLDCSYHYDVDQNGHSIEGRGGAYHLQDMINFLKTKKLSETEIMKSLMLTYYYCQDRGKIIHKGESIIAFGDLYDKYAPADKKYSDVLSHCKNSDYDRRRKREDVGSTNTNQSPSQELVQQFFRRLYEKVKTND